MCLNVGVTRHVASTGKSIALFTRYHAAITKLSKGSLVIRQGRARHRVEGAHGLLERQIVVQSRKEFVRNVWLFWVAF